ncbi:MAG: hypothetical protein IJ906_05455 [Oscillospiraceae bacterium]|nr:hypothetical protein [Oscillospiraceae bacterium]
MKEQELKAILQNADEQLAEQIASDYPTVDKSAKQRIFQEIQRRKSISAPDVPYTESQSVPIRQKHRTPWLAYVGTAAALLLMVGGVMQIAGKMQRVQPEPNLPSPAQTVPITEMPAQNMTEAATPPETVPVELTKELLYSRCMATIRYLHQVSGHIEIWYSQFEDKSTADVKMDYDANRFYGITNQIEVSTGRYVSQDESFMSADRQVGFWDIKEWDFTYSDGAPGHSEKSKVPVMNRVPEILTAETQLLTGLVCFIPMRNSIHRRIPHEDTCLTRTLGRSQTVWCIRDVTAL